MSETRVGVTSWPIENGVGIKIAFASEPQEGVLIAIDRVVGVLRGRFRPVRWEACEVEDVVDADWDLKELSVWVAVLLRDFEEADNIVEAFKTMLNRACRAQTLPYMF